MGMKKRILSSVLVVIMIFSMAITTSAQTSEISVVIDGQQILFEGQNPINIDGHILVPVRDVFEHMGFEVVWNAERQEERIRVANVGYDTNILTIIIGSPTFTFYCNFSSTKEEISLDVPAQRIGGTTMLPIRPVLEAWGSSVGWDAETSTVLISTMPFIGNWELFSVDDIWQTGIRPLEIENEWFVEFRIDGTGVSTTITSNGTQQREFVWTVQEWEFGRSLTLDYIDGLTDVNFFSDFHGNRTGIHGIMDTLTLVDSGGDWRIRSIFRRVDAASTPAVAIPSTTAVVSDEVQEAIENFLMQFPMMFANPYNGIFGGNILEGEQRFFGIPRQYGFELDDGRFNLGWDSASQQEIITNVRRFHIGYEFGERITHTWENRTWESGSQYPIFTYDMPDIFFRQFEDWERTGFYDRDGNRIVDANWMFWDSLYATGFSLWDFDRNGIPVIFVYYLGHYEGSGDGGTPTSMFRFIDGEYRRVTRTNAQWGGAYSWSSGFTPQYYFDANGNLIINSSGVDSFWYDQFVFDNENNTVTIAELVFSTHTWDGYNLTSTWENLMTGATNISMEGYIINNTSQYIPGTNIALTRIYPLTELQEEIVASIIQRLGDM